MADKVCYGQPYIVKDQLIQDTVTFTEGGESYNGTNVIIENIWEDLMAGSHQYKKSGKKYFYWEVTWTNDEGEDIFVKYECPNPTPGLFDSTGLKEELDPEEYEEGSYPRYWAEKINKAKKNYEEKAAIQKKEIIFAENKTVDYQNGSIVTNEKYSVKNSDLGFIENLLSIF